MAALTQTAISNYRQECPTEINQKREKRKEKVSEPSKFSSLKGRVIALRNIVFTPFVYVAFLIADLCVLALSVASAAVLFALNVITLGQVDRFKSLFKTSLKIIGQTFIGAIALPIITAGSVISGVGGIVHPKLAVKYNDFVADLLKASKED